MIADTHLVSLRFLLLAVLLGGSLVAIQAQQTTGPREYLRLVYQNYPEAQIADLLPEYAAANLLSARGGFDPLLYGDYDRKTFKDTEYWDTAEGGVMIPTIGGLEFGAGYRTARGEFLNEEQTIPAVGQAFASVKANLLQGLVLDERRTALQRAQLLNDWNNLEADVIRNEVAFDAMLAYLDASFVISQLEIVENSILNNRFQLDQAIIGFEAGALAALDTLEIFMQLQQRKLERTELETDLAAIDADIDLYTQEAVVTSEVASLQELDDFLLVYNNLPGFGNNPELRAYEFKLADLQIERRFKAQKRLPKLFLKYEALADGFDFTPTDGEGNSVGQFILNDNKFQAGFSVPIPNRAARGELQIADLKIRENTLLRDLKLQQLTQKFEQYQQQVFLQNEQLDRQEELVDGYRQLLEAEQLRFRLGDSSAFYVNIRENKYLEGLMKQLKTQKDLLKSKLALHYVTGNFMAW